MLNWVESIALNLGASASNFRITRDDYLLEELIVQCETFHGALAELASRQENAVLV